MEEVGGRDSVCWTEGVRGADTDPEVGADTDPEGGGVPVSFGNTICALHKFSVQQQK